jgi:hypothetical protein
MPNRPFCQRRHGQGDHVVASDDADCRQPFVGSDFNF